jgi:hypothetical protein
MSVKAQDPQSPEPVVELARPIHSLSYRLYRDYLMEGICSSVSGIVPHTSQTPQLSFLPSGADLISFYFTGQTVPPTASNRAPSLAPIDKQFSPDTTRLCPSLANPLDRHKRSTKNVVRIDSAFDTQQARVVVTPEDTLQGWFVGVSLPTIRRARIEHFGGGLKVMELGCFW